MRDKKKRGTRRREMTCRTRKHPPGSARPVFDDLP